MGNRGIIWGENVDDGGIDVGEDTLSGEMYSLLLRLGVTPNYRGCLLTARAASLAALQPQRLLLVTKWLYPQVAREFGTTWYAVERNIRTAVTIAWTANPALLETLAGCPLARRPSPAQLLGMLANSLNSRSAA